MNLGPSKYSQVMKTFAAKGLKMAFYIFDVFVQIFFTGFEQWKGKQEVTKIS